MTEAQVKPEMFIHHIVIFTSGLITSTNSSSFIKLVVQPDQVTELTKSVIYSLKFNIVFESGSVALIFIIHSLT